MNLTQLVSKLSRKSRSNLFCVFLRLPRLQREAPCAVYAFYRIVDDAVDLGHDRAAGGCKCCPCSTLGPARLLAPSSF